MKLFWLITLCFTLGCATVDKKERIREILNSDFFFSLEKDQESLQVTKNLTPNRSAKIKIDKKIKVGIIETGNISSSFLYKTKVTVKKVQDQISSKYKKSVRDGHTEAVIASFYSNLKEKDNVDVFLCSIENILLLDQCLAWFEKEKVSAINISIEFDIISQSSVSIVNEFIKNNVLIVHAAGNENKVSKGLCSLFKEIACIGALEKNLLNPASYSNYGENVSGWALGELEWDNQVFIGTSIAAPMFLAKVINDQRGEK